MLGLSAALCPSGVVQRRNLPPQPRGLLLGGGASARGGGPDQLWPRRPGLGRVMGGEADRQGGHHPGLPQRYPHDLLTSLISCFPIMESRKSGIWILTLLFLRVQVCRGHWWRVRALRWGLHMFLWETV